MKNKTFFLSAIFLLALTGCFPSAPVRARYALDPALAPPARTLHGHGVMRVEMPDAEPALSGTRIEVENDGRVSPVENAVWVEPLPTMLQTLLMRALDNSGAFSAVVDDYSPVNASLVLSTHIERFTLVYSPGKPAHVEVAFTADFFRPYGTNALKSLHLTESEPVKELRMHEVVASFERALTRCFTQVDAAAARLR